MRKNRKGRKPEQKPITIAPGEPRAKAREADTHTSAISDDPQPTQLEEAFALLKIDFEQRSQHVTQLAIDRSKFIHICLLVWGSPLLIGAAMIHKDSNLSTLPDGITSLDILGASFVASSLINCSLLCSIIGNRNSSILATSASNYIRRFYAWLLLKKCGIPIHKSALLAIQLSEDEIPVFRIATSRTTDHGIYLTATINILYALAGCWMLLPHGKTTICLGLLLILFLHVRVLLLRKVSIK